MSEEPDEGFRVTDRRRRDEPAAPREPARGAAGAAAPCRGPGDQRNLRGLFMMLASEAVIALGDEPDPTTGQRHRDLAGAAEVIDLLLLLRQKTEGNRTAEETQILDEFVYDLQLRYVRATKSSA